MAPSHLQGWRRRHAKCQAAAVFAVAAPAVPHIVRKMPIIKKIMFHVFWSILKNHIQNSKRRTDFKKPLFFQVQIQNILKYCNHAIFRQWRRAVLLLGHSDFQTLHHLWGYNEYGTITGLLANACPEIAPLPLCYAETFGPETLNKNISTNCGLACYYLMKTKSCFWMFFSRFIPMCIIAIIILG